MDRVEFAEAFGQALSDPGARSARGAFVRRAADAIANVGSRLYFSGFALGDDADRALSLVSSMGGSVARGACDLLDSGNVYAAAALLRQLVEVEYLLWTFVDDPEDARRWLHASKSQLSSRFRPAEMRKRSDGRFRAAEYAAHCDNGGHPSPRGWHLVSEGYAPGHDSPVDATDAMRFDLALHLDRAWRLLIEACDALGRSPAYSTQVAEVDHACALWRRDDAPALGVATSFSPSESA